MSERVIANPTYIGTLTGKFIEDGKTKRAIKGFDLRTDNTLADVGYHACTFTVTSSGQPTEKGELANLENRGIFMIHITKDSRLPRAEIIIGSWDKVDGNRAKFKMKNISKKEPASNTK
jgi:hypothetical protein